MGLGVLRSFFGILHSQLLFILGHLPWSTVLPLSQLRLRITQWWLVVGVEVLDFPGPTSVPGSMPRLQKCALVSIHSLCFCGSQTLPRICGEFGAGEILSPPPLAEANLFYWCRITGPRVFPSHPPGKISFASTLPTEAMGLWLVPRARKEHFLPTTICWGKGLRNDCCPSSNGLKLLLLLKIRSAGVGTVLCLFLRVTRSPLMRFDLISFPVLAMLCYAKSHRLCPTLCDPIDGSPPGSPIPRILQARTLEWVAISFFNAWKWKVKVKLLSRLRLLATPWTAAYQAPPSMGFSRQEYWSGMPFPSPSSLPTLSNLKCWFSSRYCCGILENYQYKDIPHLLSVVPAERDVTLK